MQHPEVITVLEKLSGGMRAAKTPEPNEIAIECRLIENGGLGNPGVDAAESIGAVGTISTANADATLSFAGVPIVTG
jgi:hypothetical protein